MASSNQSGRVNGADCWPVQPSSGGRLGLLSGVALLLLATVGLYYVGSHPFGPLTLAVLVCSAGLVAGGIVVCRLTVGYHRLSYRFAPGALVVETATGAETVPLSDIEGIYGGQRAGQLEWTRGLRWPGYYRGLVRSQELGPLLVFGTSLRSEALSVVATTSLGYVLTPSDPPDFRRELVRRIESADDTAVGPTHARPIGAEIREGLLLSLFVVAAVLSLTDLSALIFAPPNGPADTTPQLVAVLSVFTLNTLLSIPLWHRERAAVVLLGATACLTELFLLVATLRPTA